MWTYSLYIVLGPSSGVCRGLKSRRRRWRGPCAMPLRLWQLNSMSGGADAPQPTNVGHLPPSGHLPLEHFPFPIWTLRIKQVSKFIKQAGTYIRLNRSVKCYFKIRQPHKQSVKHKNMKKILHERQLCFQCFDAVSWTAGRASGL